MVVRNVAGLDVAIAGPVPRDRSGAARATAVRASPVRVRRE